MATSNQQLIADNSSLANFKNWAKAISDFMTTAGWTQAGDTGQVNWTSIASVPTAGNFVYEIWTPGDGLQTFCLKLEYGTDSGSPVNPKMRVTLSTTTNGAGTCTGFVTTIAQPTTSFTGQGSNTFNCYFCGDSGRIGIMMYRDLTTVTGGWFFGVQRSLNSSGTTYGTSTTGYATLLALFNDGGGHNASFQQSIVFGVGVSNIFANIAASGTAFACLKRKGSAGGTDRTTDLFNGQIPISPVFPDVGFFDNPMDIVAIGCSSDFTEGAFYTIASGNMPYGVAHTYVATKNYPMAACAETGAVSTFLMRYD